MLLLSCQFGSDPPRGPAPAAAPARRAGAQAPSGGKLRPSSWSRDSRLPSQLDFPLTQHSVMIATENVVLVTLESVTVTPGHWHWHSGPPIGHHQPAANTLLLFQIIPPLIFPNCSFNYSFNYSLRFQIFQLFV